MSVQNSKAKTGGGSALWKRLCIFIYAASALTFTANGVSANPWIGEPFYRYLLPLFLWCAALGSLLAYKEQQRESAVAQQHDETPLQQP